MPRAIRVLVADEYEVVRHGVRLILEQDPTIRVIGQARSAAEAIEVVPRLDPDVVVADVDHPAIVQRIKERSARVRVLVLTDCSDPAFVRGVIGAGADAVLLMQGSSARLVRAVHALGRGEPGAPILDPTLALRSRPLDVAAELLSEREREILSLVAAGHTSKGIARLLQLSPRTVGNHRARIMAKLQVENCVQAAAQALQLGLIAAPSPRPPPSEPRLPVWATHGTPSRSLAAVT